MKDKKVKPKATAASRKSRVKKSAPPADHAPDPLLLLPGMIRAAKACGAILRRYYEQLSKANLEVSEKIGAGLVTNADIESERACVAALRKIRPDFSFLTEEGTAARSVARGRWIIDPLDGTTNFVHRFPMFCVSIAAEWDGEVIAGVIEHPILRETYVASLGGGATVNGRKLEVSKTSKLADSLLSTGFTYRKTELLQTEMVAFEELSSVARAIRRPGSAALDLAYTARGVFDGFWERRLSPWDVAAGLLLVREAGGTVTDFCGGDKVVESPAILATNGKLHATLLAAVQTPEEQLRAGRREMD
ncbi:MAG: inositol monophosphatase [Cryobacterium sp.]|nr:inositol monophosphatase [Oligoflexia bacterium]